MRIVRLTLLVILTCGFVWPCFGWGPEGHRIIGDIATKYLSAKSKAAIKDLLGDQSLADVSNWADEVRKDSAYDYLKPLHFINVPRSAAKIDLSRDCKNQQCVIGAINHYTEVLKNKKSTREEKITALKLIVHFVGDVHQPLHVSYEDDRGGNFVKVKYMGNADRNLHAIWDGPLVEHQAKDDREAYEKSLLRKATDANLKKWRASLNPTDWGNESLTLTRTVYKDVPKGKDQVMVIDEAYCKKQGPIINERLTAAGVRLAALLNSIFGDDKPSKLPTTRPATQPTTAPAAVTDEPATSQPAEQP